MNEMQLKSLQGVILMIAKDFDAFCRENGITYYMMGGTALGAMRHGGFIPWDDDFDVFMDRDNYLKLLRLGGEYFPTEKYCLQREDTDEWPLFFCKLRLNDTHYAERDNAGRQMHTGIYIDIMCLNSAWGSPILRRMQYLTARVISAYCLARRGYETTSLKKRAALAVARAVGFPPLKALLLKIVRGGERSGSRFVGHFFGRAPFHATSFERSVLGQPRYVPFEDTTLPVPVQVENYLKVRFGSTYMAMPSAAVRASFPSHVEAFDLGPWASENTSL